MDPEVLAHRGHQGGLAARVADEPHALQARAQRRSVLRMLAEERLDVEAGLELEALDQGREELVDRAPLLDHDYRSFESSAIAELQVQGYCGGYTYGPIRLSNAITQTIGD